MTRESNVVFVLQAFQETIEIFQQKNESFKNALKDVEEVSVSVTSELHGRMNLHRSLPSYSVCVCVIYIYMYMSFFF